MKPEYKLAMPITLKALKSVKIKCRTKLKRAPIGTTNWCFSLTQQLSWFYSTNKKGSMDCCLEPFDLVRLMKTDTVDGENLTDIDLAIKLSNHIVRLGNNTMNDTGCDRVTKKRCNLLAIINLYNVFSSLNCRFSGSCDADGIQSRLVKSKKDIRSARCVPW